MVTIINSIKKFNFRLFFALCSFALFPAVYESMRMYFISDIPLEGIYNIVGQLEWFDLIDETFKAFLVIPLYSVFNRYFADKENFSQRVIGIGVVVIILYSLFSVGVYIYTSNLVDYMGLGDIDIVTTSTWLRLQTLSFVVGVVFSVLYVVLVVVGKDLYIYLVLAGQMVITVVSDLLLIPKYGVNGIAYSNIGINLIMILICILVLANKRILTLKNPFSTDMQTLKKWAVTGLFSGCHVFVDNIIYAVMIVKMVNLVSEQGNYWMANNFIWGWLLIPVFALGEVIKSDCKTGYKKENTKIYYAVTGVIVMLWGVSIPGWKWFFGTVYNYPEPNRIFDIVIKLLPFYVFYGLSVIIDSLFYGLGKTIYNFVNSLIINLGYYGLFYVLYLTDTITFNMDTIIIMFGLGMVFHWIVSVFMKKNLVRKRFSPA